MAEQTTKKETKLYELGDAELCFETCAAKIGDVYPIYGHLTNLWEGVPGMIVAELERSTIALIFDADPEFVTALKQRMFEPGIFISRILMHEDGKAVVHCTRALFSKQEQTLQ